MSLPALSTHSLYRSHPLARGDTLKSRLRALVLVPRGHLLCLRFQLNREDTWKETSAQDGQDVCLLSRHSPLLSTNYPMDAVKRAPKTFPVKFRSSGMVQHSPPSVLFLFPNRLANCWQYGNKLYLVLFYMIIIIQIKVEFYFSYIYEIGLMKFPHSFLYIAFLIGHFLHVTAFALAW